ncbi:MAG: nucleotidyltransferase family protein [Rhodothermales bacterium]
MVRDDPGVTHADLGDERGYLPTPFQELLLRAALLDGEPALSAWETWKQGVDIDRVAMPSAGLLPLLYKNLLENGLADPLMEDLKKRYTITWYNNQVAFRRMAGILARFRDAGIETILLKGAAMTLAYYKDHGVRPMGDIDVLVKPECVAAATEILLGDGFKTSSPLSSTATRYMHAAHFVDEKAFALDLHWRLLWEFSEPGADAEFWSSAEDSTLGVVTTKVLKPTDQLFHACVHGARWNSAPVRWVADTMTIIAKAGPEIDFQRLVATAKAHRLQLPIRHTLGYLHSTWSAAIRQDTLETLDKMAISRLDRFLYHNLTENRASLVMGNLPMHLLHFLRMTRRIGFRRRMLELPHFLAFVWSLNRVREVPVSILAKTLRRITKLFVSSRPSR